MSIRFMFSDSQRVRVKLEKCNQQIKDKINDIFVIKKVALSVFQGARLVKTACNLRR